VRPGMAEVPEGAELTADGELVFPAVVVRNIYILPGVPEIFRQKFDALKERFRDAPFHLCCVYVSMGEGTLADHLNALLVGHPDLLLGSYPEFSNPEYKVKVTLESKDRGYLDDAVTDLLARLPQDAVVRVDPRIADLVPRFVQNARRDAAQARAALEARDLDRVRSIGHTLRGSASSYGFDTLARLGALLEHAARNEDVDSARRVAMRLVDYLARVETRFD